MSANSTRQLLYLSYLIAQIGSWAFRVGILVGLLQESIGAVGIGVAVIFAPIIFGSLLLSPIVDRVNRLKAMIFINALRICTLIPLLFLVEVNTFGTYLSIAFLSIFQPVYMSAQVSFLRGVTSETNMVSVLRNLTNIEWLTYVLGMSAGAALIAQLNLSVVLLLNIFALVLCIGILSFIKARSQSIENENVSPKSGTLGDLKPLYTAFLAVFFLNLGAGIINVYPAIRSTVDGVTDQSALTTIVIANGIFGFLGALSVKPIYERLGALRTMASAALFIAFSLVAMSLEFGLTLAVASSSAMLGSGQIFAVSAQTHMVASVQADRAGQLSGLFQCCTFGGIAANGILFATLGSAVSFSSVILICAVSAFAALCLAGLSAFQTERANYASTF